MTSQAQIGSNFATWITDLTSASLIGARGAERRSIIVWGRRISGLVVTIVAALIATIRIGNPSPWADEAVTVLVTRGEWAALPPLLGGADAPLVPYYALAKAWAALLPWLSTLTAVRLLSAVAGALTVWAVFQLVARRIGFGPGALVALVLASFPGWSRYAQEARPYALLVLMATLLWLAWDARPDSRQVDAGASDNSRSRWIAWVPYVAGLGGSVLFHLFGLLQWPAQLLADLTTPGLDRKLRLRRLARSITAMVVAAVLFGVPLVVGALRGTGAPRLIPLTVRQLVIDLVVVVGAVDKPLALIPVVAFILIALLGCATGMPAARRYADLVRIAVIWTAVPLVLSVLAATLRPSLLRARYWMPAAVPLAILTAVGILVVAQLVLQGLRAVTQGALRRPGIRLGAAALAVLICVGSHVYLSIPQQRFIRSEAGHTQAARGAVSQMKKILASHPELPVGTSPYTRSTILWAMDEGLEPIDILQMRDPLANTVWPANRSTGEVDTLLAGRNRMLWMRAIIQSTPKPTLPPKPLQQLGFRVVSAEKVGSWWVCIVERG